MVCGQPTPPVHGRVSVHVVGNITGAVYSCNSGYQMQGMSFTVCITSLSVRNVWGDPPPLCVPGFEPGEDQCERLSTQHFILIL